MKVKSLTEEDIAKICGVKQPSVHLWKTTGRISNKNLIKLCEHFSMTIDDFMRGSAALDTIPTKQIPVISWVQAGSWKDNGDLNYDEYISTDSTVPRNCFALRVNGDSMTSQSGGKSIPEGAIVIVCPCELPPEDLNHKVVIAVNGDGETTMKEFVYDGSKAFLKPWNTALYSIMPVTPATKIIGYVMRYQVAL